MAILLYLGVAVISWVIWDVLALYRNYQKAKSIGLPIVLAPVAIINPLWLIAAKFAPNQIRKLRYVPLLGRLWTRCSYLGWQFDDDRRESVHHRIGPAFVLCNPSNIEVFVADPAAAHNILSRRKDFIKPTQIYDALNVFGRNVLTADGEVWQRHRRLTAPSLNDRVNETVWAEAVGQCTEVLHKWVQCSERGTRDTSQDCATLAMNVWMRAGFGISIPYHGLSDTKQLHRVRYKDALMRVVNNFTVLAVLPRKWLTLRYMPSNVQRVGEAVIEFEQGMKAVLNDEKTKVAESVVSQGNLLSTLVHANEEALADEMSRKTKLSLGDDELYGNMFIYSFAGFETTANALTTAITYLAAYPKWQKWLTEEIQNVVGRNSQGEEWEFDVVFPKMKRCMAIMAETVTIKDSIHVIPPNTYVCINSHHIHYDAAIWGADADSWRPDRWIKQSGLGEELIEPESGTFLPWADGPRACPGRKFAQVEFVGVMTPLFQNHAVMPVPEKGQSAENAHIRTCRMIEDSGVTAITLQMRHPRSVAMAWEKNVK